MPSARDVDLDDEETRLKALNAGVSFWKQRAIHARSSSSISSNRAAVTSSKRAFGALAGTSANASSEPMLSFPPQASLPSSSSSYVSSSAVVLKTGGDFAFSPGAHK